MTITENKQGRVTIISLKGNLFGEPETTALRETIYRSAERGEKHVLLDLGGLKATNSTGLGVLVSALTSLRRKGGELALAGLSEKVHALLVITYLIRVFKVYDTVDRAVVGFGR